MPDLPTIPPVPGVPADLPMQPSGSGVADLAVAVERMALADAAADPAADGAQPVPTTTDGDARDSEAHPS